MLQSTLDAIVILERTYTALLTDDSTPAVVRRIVYRALGYLESDARRQLTGE